MREGFASTIFVTTRLNDDYALDGGAPPSYGGLLWCLGWRDRPGANGRPRPRRTSVLSRRVELGALERRAKRRLSGDVFLQPAIASALVRDAGGSVRAKGAGSLCGAAIPSALVDTSGEAQSTGGQSVEDAEKNLKKNLKKNQASETDSRQTPVKRIASSVPAASHTAPASKRGRRASPGKPLGGTQSSLWHFLNRSSAEALPQHTEIGAASLLASSHDDE